MASFEPLLILTTFYSVERVCPGKKAPQNAWMQGAVPAASASLFVFSTKHLPAEQTREEEAPPGEEAARAAQSLGRRVLGQGPEQIKYPWGVAPPGTSSRGARGAGAEPAGRGGPDPPPPSAPPTAQRPVLARSGARRRRGHGVQAEPAEQPGGGEHRGALCRQAGERPGRLPPLLPAPPPAEAARGAAESLASALRAAGGVAAGDPGHHPRAQAGARRAHPQAA